MTDWKAMIANRSFHENDNIFNKVLIGKNEI